MALTATLTSAFGSPTGTVSFFEGSVLLGSGQLDPQGHVTITLSGLAAGRHTIVASYTGEGLFASSTSKPLEQLVRVPTVVSYTGATMLATKMSATLSATLEQTGGAPLRGKPLILTLGAGGTAQSCPASTDAAGEAACTVTIAQPLGPGTVSAAFAGDDAYEPSNDSQKTLVYAYSSGGSFVVGAPGTVGSSVTFWSARWGQRNPLAGGAPAAFKGFENDPARPSCGAPWTSQPGNSSGPPSTVPRYVAVIVSARVTQSGAKVNGDTVHVAIVHTDSGYAASPGHPGTGTVVALIC